MAPPPAPPVLPVRTVTQFLRALNTLTIGTEFRLYRGQRVDSALLPKIGRADGPDDPIAVEADLMREFQRRSFGLMNDRPASNDLWAWMAIAQHHGLATRLLDWTDNPLVALYFAVELATADDNPVVWVVATEGTDVVDVTTLDAPSKLDKTLFYRPMQVTQRLRAQGGWFSAHYHNKSTKKFSALNALGKYKSRLVKLSIDPTKVKSIRRALESVGFSRANLYPDLDGLCVYLNRCHIPSMFG